MRKTIFLLERNSSLSKHRVSLGLARISTQHKEKGDLVHHFVMNSKTVFPSGLKPDLVYISIVFSWDTPYFVKLINTLKETYGLTNESIIIGGVSTLYMKEYIIKNTGIIPHTGCSRDLDLVVPDSSLDTNDSTYVFTMRSCKNACSFCIVNQLEPEFYSIDNWKEQIDLNKKYIYICDNNLLTAPIEHRKAVFGYLSEIANINGTKIPGSRGKIREVILDGGLDWRNLTPENIELIKNIRFNKLRVAFDDVRYEKGFDKAMQLLLEAFPKVSKRGIHENIECYVLYNCNFTKDTLEDTLYRVYKLRHHYKVYPYAMRFQPLDTLTYKSYVSPYWSEQDVIDIGRWANNRTIAMKVKSFKNYYGRKSDGKCLSTTSPEQRQILSIYAQRDVQLDFSKSYKENLPLLKKEISERKEAMRSISEQFEQLMLVNI